MSYLNAHDCFCFALFVLFADSVATNMIYRSFVLKCTALMAKIMKQTESMVKGNRSTIPFFQTEDENVT